MRWTGAQIALSVVLVAVISSIGGLSRLDKSLKRLTFVSDASFGVERATAFPSESPEAIETRVTGAKQSTLSIPIRTPEAIEMSLSGVEHDGADQSTQPIPTGKTTPTESSRPDGVKSDVQSAHTSATTTTHTTNQPTVSLTGTPDADPRPRGLRLAMMGDSVTRYQYLSLAYFLRKGEWWDENRHKPFDLVNEHTFQSFAHFYSVVTNKWLAPYERCDCYRPKCDVYSFIDIVTENRYFWEPSRDNLLVYIGSFGHYGSPHGRFSPEEALQNIPAFQYNHDNFSESQFQWFSSDWDWVIREHIAKLSPKPTHVLLNAGIWDHNFRNETLRQRLFDAIKETNMTGIWKTTSYHLDLGPYTAKARMSMASWFTKTKWYDQWFGNCTGEPNADILLPSKLVKKIIYKPDSGMDANELDPIMCKLLGNCLDTLWSNCIRQKFYFDGIHFNEPAYRLFNEELLEIVGHPFPSNYSKKDRQPYMRVNRSICWVLPELDTYHATPNRNVSL